MGKNLSVLSVLQWHMFSSYEPKFRRNLNEREPLKFSFNFINRVPHWWRKTRDEVGQNDQKKRDDLLTVDQSVTGNGPTAKCVSIAIFSNVILIFHPLPYSLMLLTIVVIRIVHEGSSKYACRCTREGNIQATYNNNTGHFSFNHRNVDECIWRQVTFGDMIIITSNHPPVKWIWLLWWQLLA